MLCLFNICHFSSTVCSAAMAKRIQQESGEERVTAKSRHMMNLTARMPSVVSSSTSSSPVKTWYGYQDPGKSVVVDDRRGQPDRLSPAGYSKEVDFHIPGLPYSTVKRLHGASVRELIQKIENHPDRHALQKDLQQNQSFNPFSQESKEMIHEVGNIELCELLDMGTKAHCKVCLSYWDVGIVYCTCRHFLRNGTEENKKFVQYTMDLLSIPNYYIKKGRPHGHRYGKKPGDHEYFIANSLKKKCKKKNFLGIHDRFIRDEKFRKNMFDVGRTEEIRRVMDKIGERRPHAPHHSRRNSSVQKQLVNSFEHSWFRYDASSAST